MKTIASLFLAIALTGCVRTTGTTVYDRKTGRKVLETSGDSTTIGVTASGAFYATGLNHSIPIAARAAGVTAIVRGTGAAVGEGGRVFINPVR